MILKELAAQEVGVTVVVSADGNKFAVRVRDDDSGQYLPVTRFHHEIGAAMAYAESVHAANMA